MMEWKNTCDCDVKDKEHLAPFREKLITWKNYLNGQDAHSIFQQTTKLLWCDIVYRTYNEAVGLSNKTRAPSTGVPATMWELLDLQFMDMQAVAIRRLTEHSPHDPQRAVYSLRRIINEIQENIELYTRENYVCYDGITYEELTNDKPQMKEQREYRQRNFDILSKKNEKTHTRNDKIENGKIFENIEKDFSTIKTVCQYVNKYVAHASDPKNRGKISLPDKVTLKKLDDSYKAILRIGRTIGLLIDEFFSCEVLTRPVIDPLENWDKPIITPKDCTKLHDYWRRRIIQIQNWNEKIHPYYEPRRTI